MSRRGARSDLGEERPVCGHVGDGWSGEAGEEAGVMIQGERRSPGPG